MIAGIGIDIADITRIEDLLKRYGMRFLQRILTPGEIASCMKRHDAAACIAGRFAAKEAAYKALSSGRTSGIGFKDITVDTDGSAPRLTLARKALDRAAQIGVARIHVSISHDRGCAVALVVLETS
ncbi:MAG TPA: holo-ACP synthase [Deltaproteobacteria bacterium]|nr:holo-ACP synthase [Deltaproteobacteria bacterium]HPR54368.1 holo-ACP synthase [Deltaproteobacteria bacterium]HXK46993.1 holo-ACP synthase [Deltaproteobacteria bacterium]